MAMHGRRHSVIPPPAKPTSRKKAFNLDDMFASIEQAIRPYKKAAMFELAEAGYKTPFEQLVACIISIRTFDEVSAPTARRLLDVARTPAEVVRLGVARIDELIHAA